MARDRIIALIVRPAGVEWAVLGGGGRGRGAVVASGGLNLPAAPVAPTAGEAAAEPAAPTLAQRLAGQEVPLRGPVTLGIDSGQLLLRVVRLPSSDPAELTGMVELQADKLSPFPVETMAFSHEVLHSSDERSVVLIVAVKHAVLNDIHTRLEGTGLRPERVDAVVMGWWHLLKEAHRVSAEGREILVLLTDAGTDLVVVDNGVPVFFRSLAVGPGTPPDALAEEIAAEVAYTLLSIELESPVRGEHAITLWHTGEEPAGLGGRLAQACGCAVNVACLDGFGRAAEGLARRTAAGAEARINLTPATWKDTTTAREFRRKTWTVFGAMAGVWAFGVAVFIGGFALETYQGEALRRERSTVGAEARTVREMRERVRMIQHYTNQTHSAIECLRETCVHWAPGVELTSFSYRKGESVKISGIAQTVQQVYAFKSNLDRSSVFKKADLVGPRLNPRDGKQGFDITLALPADES